MALRKAISIDSEEASTPYDVRKSQAQAQGGVQTAGMFGGNNKWLLIGGLAIAAYLAFAPTKKTKASGSGLNGSKAKKRKAAKRKK